MLNRHLQIPCAQTPTSIRHLALEALVGLGSPNPIARGFLAVLRLSGDRIRDAFAENPTGSGLRSAQYHG
jgi:hypothetical protein